MQKTLSQKLFSFQKEVGSIVKDLENPYFKSQYFDVNKVIEIIKPVLDNCGLVVLQPLTIVENRPAIKTIIIDSESGDGIQDIAFLPDLPKAQDAGSAITYFRRYSLVSFLLLQGEIDDDGNKASEMSKEEKERYGARKVEPVKNTKTIQNPNNDLPFISK